MTLDLSVCLVTDTDICRSAGRSVVETVAAAAAGGATAVQLREKDSSTRAFLQLVTAVSAVLPEHVALFVNDRVDVYAAARARGVRVTGIHVGQSDLPVSTVRAIAGPEAV
ncbi:thiamine monophosphate synthase/TENI, partial [Leifsonia aquatica ATCC 14665]